MKTRYTGIDLGTTNSTVSISYTKPNSEIESQTLEVLQIDESGNNMILDPALPSVVYLDDDNQPYVGRFAKRMSGVYPRQVIKEAKRYIGKEANWEINKRKIRPDEVSSYILKLLKTQVEDFFGQEIEGVVITVPANFNFQQENATRYAAELAGFKKGAIHTIPEPTAALIDFLNEEQKFDRASRRIDITSGSKRLLVFDLGGGTCDVSILQVQSTDAGGIDIQELSVSQYTELGGIDFDRQVAKHLLSKLIQDLGMRSIKEIRDQYGDDAARLLLENLTDVAEKAKKNFASKIDNQLRLQGLEYFNNTKLFDNITYREMLSHNLPAPLITTIAISKLEYDTYIEDLLYKEKSKSGKNIEDPIIGALLQSKIGPLRTSDIDAVFLVGGMTYYPTVQDRIFEIFDRRIKPLKSVNPMFAVSRGASVYHQSLDRIHLHSSHEIEDVSRNVIFTNTVPTSVYIEVVNGDPVQLLEKGTLLPFEQLIEGKFYVTGQSVTDFVNTMQLDLYTAITAKAFKQTKLKSATITFKKPVPVKSPIVLHVSCNEEREVSVKAWLQDDESEVIDVNLGSHEYSNEEIQQLIERHQAINKIKE
jgi:molecular chaperone DnaK